MKLTDRLRKELKNPLGRIVEDAEDVPCDGVLVCVGDTASETLIKAGRRPKLIVYDARTRREEVGVADAIKDFDVRQYRVENPPGHLREEVFSLFEDIISSDGAAKVYVEGEEDLTALAAITHAPLGSTVVYGQPGEGMVVVEVDTKIKEKVKKLIEEMKDGR